MTLRLLRAALALSCPLLAVAKLYDLSGIWTIPLALFCMVNASIVIAEGRLRRGDETTVLGLNR